MTLKIHCPECRGQFQVDGEESRSRFECPFCEAPFRFQDKQTVVLSSSPLTQVEVEKIENPTANETSETSSTGAKKLAPPPPPATPSKGAGRPPPPPPPPPPPGTPTAKARVVPMPEDLTTLRPGDVLGGYRLEEVIGWGGMSVVFRAKQLSLGRNVAVKVLRHELGEDAEFSRRFLNEAQALAELAHPNIVQVIDQGIHEGNHYLVMEYIDGVSLREVLAERRLTPPEALRLIPELCSALEYAHDRGIIHRDIKPENILVTQSGLPKIADFGLVRMLGTKGEEYSRLTQTRTILGTVDYMAPEQREGQSDVDHRADIYSLGVVLYEMLTGELPIAHFPLPSEKVQLDVRIDDVVLKVLQKDRDHRYQRASMVASDLASFEGTKNRGRGLTGHRSPASWIGRVAALVWFPFVLIFFGTASRDEDVFFGAFGASIPLLLTHLRSYGWLPSVPSHVRSYRWMLWAGAGLMFVFFQNHVIEDEPGVFAFAFLLSSAFLSGRKIWDEDGVPPQSAGRRRRLETSSHPSPGIVATPASRGEGPKAVVPPREAHDDASQVVSIAADSAPPPIAPAPFQNEEEGAVSSTVAASAMQPVGPLAAAPPSRPRASVPLILAFVLALLTLIPSAGLSTALLVTGDAWKTVLLNAPMEYRDVQEGLREVAGFSPEPARAAVSMGRLLMLVPLAIPTLLALLSLPGVLNKRRRSPSLLIAVFGLIALQAGLMVVATRPVVHTVDEYCAEYDRGAASSQGDNPVEVLLTRAEGVTTPVERIALLHRAAAIGATSDSPDLGSPLVRMALNGRLTPQERKLSLALLERDFTGDLASDSTFPSVPDWFQRFTSLASPDSQIPRELRDGFIEVLSQVPRPELSGLFRELVERGGYRDSLVALRWWTQVAPEAEFDAWVADLTGEGTSSSLVHNIDRLHQYDGGANPRVTRLGEMISERY